MKKLIASAVLALSVSAGAVAYAQMTGTQPNVSSTAMDARSMASDRAVGEARRYYRAQCNRHQSAAFCECVTAGVAQALMPEEVRMAGRTIGERIGAEGDAAGSEQSDATAAMSSAARIEHVEAHYAEACVQFRG